MNAATEMRVFGPPGTGKTTYLARQVERVVEERGTDSVLVASFTRTAAREIAGRIDDLGLDMGQVGTLHALCYRALGSPTIADTKLKEWNEYRPDYRLSGGSADLDEPDQKYETDGDRVYADYQVCRARRTPSEMWPLPVQVFGGLWERWKSETGYIDFTDMISRVLDEGIPPPGNATVGFFDECQDFTPLELALVRSWSKFLDYVVLAGDDDQCIYGFKGASPDAFLSPELPVEQERVLSQSYRLPLEVYAYAGAWIDQVRRRKAKAYACREAEGRVRSESRYQSLDPVRMVEDVDEFDQVGVSTMILASCSYHLRETIRALKLAGIPFANPWRTRRGDWNPLAASRGLSTAARVIALLRPQTGALGRDARPWTVADVRAWTGLLPRTGLFRRGLARELEALPGEQTVDGDLCERIFEDGVVDAALADPLGFLEGRASAAKRDALAYPLAIARRYGIARLLQVPNVTVGTIHSVKGGEADVVYLYPDLSFAGVSEYLDARTRDSVVRQFYVGMTRARTELVLCGASGNAAIDWPGKGWSS